MKLRVHTPMEAMLRQMDLWYRTPLGTRLLEVEYATLTPYLQDNFGSRLLQVGGPGEVFLFHQSNTFHSVRISPEYKSIFKGPSVRGSFTDLPFLPDSMDVVLLPHVLELASDPFAILSQSQIVLAPEGRLIILGFNPWSVWGLCKYSWPHKKLPWCANFLSATRVKKWLVENGFEIEEMRSLFFRPPVKTEKSLEKWMPLEALGRLLWANNGAVYLMVARKHVVPLMPIGESLRYAGTG